MSILPKIVSKIHRMGYEPLARRKAKRLGAQFSPPNYVFFDNFDSNSIVLDVGCGYEAEFAQFMIEKHGLRAFGVDPTKKHFDSLKKIEDSTEGKFRHLAAAVSKEGGKITFNESNENESGSILSDHNLSLIHI